MISAYLIVLYIYRLQEPPRSDGQRFFGIQSGPRFTGPLSVRGQAMGRGLKHNANSRFDLQNGSSSKQQRGPRPLFPHNQGSYPTLSSNRSRPAPRSRPYNHDRVRTYRRSGSRSWSPSSSSGKSRSRSRSWSRSRSRSRSPPRSPPRYHRRPVRQRRRLVFNRHLLRHQDMFLMYILCL